MAHAIAQQRDFGEFARIVKSLLRSFNKSQAQSDVSPFEAHLERISLAYDDEMDVLYIRFQESSASSVIEKDGVVLFLEERRFGRPPILLGVTILDASEREESRQMIEAAKKQNES